jgi:hypothetical protein
MLISVNTVPKHLEQNCSNTLIFIFPESLQKEVEQLEEKLAELGGSVREGGAGARSLEAVRKEAEDESRISLGATSGHCKHGHWQP